MCFEWLCVIFFVMTVLNYIFLDIKVDKIKKESLDKDKVIGSLMAHNQALRRLNELFRGHECRINDVENLLLLKKPEEPKEHKEPDQPEFTCQDCEFYRALYGNYYMCNQTGCFCAKECNKPCELFKKKESLDDEEDAVFYANNERVYIPSKAYVYKTEGLLTSEDLVDRIRKLYLDGGISFADANTLLERLKQ